MGQLSPSWSTTIQGGNTDSPGRTQAWGGLWAWVSRPPLPASFLKLITDTLGMCVRAVPLSLQVSLLLLYGKRGTPWNSSDSVALTGAQCLACKDMLRHPTKAPLIPQRSSSSWLCQVAFHSERQQNWRMPPGVVHYIIKQCSKRDFWL